MSALIGEEVAYKTFRLIMLRLHGDRDIVQKSVITRRGQVAMPDE